MKKMKKLLSIIAVLLMVFCMTIPVSAAGKINKSKIILLTGQTIQLKVSEILIQENGIQLEITEPNL